MVEFRQRRQPDNQREGRDQSIKQAENNTQRERERERGRDGNKENFKFTAQLLLVHTYNFVHYLSSGASNKQLTIY